MLNRWACLAEGFNATVSNDESNLPDKRVDPGCWLRYGFESHGGNLFLFKPLSGSYHLRMLPCRATLICASFRGLLTYCHHQRLPSSSNYRCRHNNAYTMCLHLTLVHIILFKYFLFYRTFAFGGMFMKV